MKVSIVTSVKNGLPFIGDAMASVRAQTHQNWEYLIIDAGSTDGSREIVQEEAAKDSRIRLFLRESEPLYRSLNWGLSQCAGDFLAWLNADDLYPPWSFSTLCRFVEISQADWVTGFPACWDENGALRFIRPSGWRPAQFIRSGMFHLDALGFLQQESMFFSRRLFSKLSESERDIFASQKLAGDFFLWKKFAQHAPLTTVPAVLGGFRQHQANMSTHNLHEYMQEVRALGGWFPHKYVAALARRAYDAASALRAAQIVHRAEREFNQVTQVRRSR